MRIGRSSCLTLWQLSLAALPFSYLFPCAWKGMWWPYLQSPEFTSSQCLLSERRRPQRSQPGCSIPLTPGPPPPRIRSCSTAPPRIRPCSTAPPRPPTVPVANDPQQSPCLKPGAPQVGRTRTLSTTGGPPSRFRKDPYIPVHPAARRRDRRHRWC